MKTAYKILHPEHHIINYLTAIDCYKYSMGQLYLHKHPNARARWDFKIRSKNVNVAHLTDYIKIGRASCRERV